MADKRVTIQATRYDPDRDSAPRMQSYDIPFYDESMVVLDALNYIKNHVDLKTKTASARLMYGRGQKEESVKTLRTIEDAEDSLG